MSVRNGQWTGVARMAIGIGGRTCTAWPERPDYARPGREAASQGRR